MKNIKRSNDLPWELIIEVLSWLPAKPLVRFKCVSKPLKALIDDPNFIKLHHNRTLQRANSDGSGENLIVYGGSFGPSGSTPSPSLFSINYGSLTRLHFPAEILGNEPDASDAELVGSCNGLVCFHINKKDDIFLYNPVTRAYKMLPRDVDEGHETHMVAFGYDGESDDYKVLRFSYKRPHNLLEGWDLKTMIYRLKTNAWEEVKNPPIARHRRLWVPSYNVVWANNCLYWLEHGHEHEIKCFDLSTHEHRRLPLSKRISRYLPRLTVLRGQLCVVTYYVDVWVLKQNYNNGDGGKDDWTRLFRHWSRDLLDLKIRCIWEYCDTSVGCLRDGRNIIIALGSCTALKEYLICCDVDTQEATRLELPHLSRSKVPMLSPVQPWVR